MNDTISLEKHICKCGKIMEYDGLETSIVSDIDENNKILSDLDVYICNNCGYKIWIHATEHCKLIDIQ
jgi:rubrerythrin